MSDHKCPRCEKSFANVVALSAHLNWHDERFQRGKTPMTLDLVEDDKVVGSVRSDFCAPSSPTGTSPATVEVGEFHHRDGWFFKRLDDGSVRIRFLGADDGATLMLVHTIQPAEWASVIASVARICDFGGAERLHMAEPTVREDDIELSDTALTGKDRPAPYGENSTLIKGSADPAESSSPATPTPAPELTGTFHTDPSAAAKGWEGPTQYSPPVSSASAPMPAIDLPFSPEDVKRGTTAPTPTPLVKEPSDDLLNRCASAVQYLATHFPVQGTDEQERVDLAFLAAGRFIRRSEQIFPSSSDEPEEPEAKLQRYIESKLNIGTREANVIRTAFREFFEPHIAALEKEQDEQLEIAIAQHIKAERKAEAQLTAAHAALDGLKEKVAELHEFDCRSHTGGDCNCLVRTTVVLSLISTASAQAKGSA